MRRSRTLWREKEKKNKKNLFKFNKIKPYIFAHLEEQNPNLKESGDRLLIFVLTLDLTLVFSGLDHRCFETEESSKIVNRKRKNP